MTKQTLCYCPIVRAGHIIQTIVWYCTAFGFCRRGLEESACDQIKYNQRFSLTFNLPLTNRNLWRFGSMSAFLSVWNVLIQFICNVLYHRVPETVKSCSWIPSELKDLTKCLYSCSPEALLLLWKVCAGLGLFRFPLQKTTTITQCIHVSNLRDFN